MADKSIQAVLFELGLGNISQRFIEHKITFDLAKKLSDEELSALGVGTIGDRIRLKEKLNSQHRTCACGAFKSSGFRFYFR